MSEEARGEVQDASNRYLLPYGVGGDYVGARRTRRAFRLLICACVGFTFLLYFVERYMRYELNEVHYRMALTLEDDSQRAILRNVVRRDAQQRELATAKYVEALANIEEEDVVLERYAEAVRLAPEKGSLLIVYGCALFQQRQFKEARQVFREATLKTTRNALPKYLQAAALAASSETEDDFRTALALVARTNDSGEQVIFPQPLWHESLPKGGIWYESLQRRLADRVCAPFYHLKTVVARRAQEAPEEGDSQEWEAWLVQLQTMGERLVGSPTSSSENIGSSQAICGLQIQKEALAVRLALIERLGGEGGAALLERQEIVKKAMELVQQFEVERAEHKAEAEAQVRVPLLFVVKTFLLLSAFSLVCWMLSRFFRTDKNARTLRQGRAGMIVLAIWCAVEGLILIGLTWGVAADIQPVLIVVGSVLALAMAVFCVVKPAFVLPRAVEVCEPFLADVDYSERLTEARRRRRRAYLSLASRSLNITLGCYLLLLSVHFIGYRVVTGLYPTDVKLLIAGEELRKLALFQELYQLLS